MAAPVIYHGGADSRGPWPGGGGGATPSSILREVFLPASLWTVNQYAGQDNPAETRYTDESGAGPGQWMDRAIAFPTADRGGSWAQVSSWLPSNAAVAVGTFPVTILWTIETWNAPFGAVNWHVHVTEEEPGFTILGGGPGTQVNQAPTFTNILMYTPSINVPPTRLGAPVPMVAGRMYHWNLYRGDASGVNANFARFYGLVYSYNVVP